MNTEEIYYQDTHRTEFDASVLSCVPEEKKGAFLAVLDRTAFFPEQGGQRSDLGELGGAKVLDVSQVQVSRIEKKAIGMLRDMME